MVFQSFSLKLFNFCRHERFPRSLYIKLKCCGWKNNIDYHVPEWFDFCKYVFASLCQPRIYKVTTVIWRCPPISLRLETSWKGKKFLARKIEEDKWLSFVWVFFRLSTLLCRHMARLVCRKKKLLTDGNKMRSVRSKIAERMDANDKRRAEMPWHCLIIIFMLFQWLFQFVLWFLCVIAFFSYPCDEMKSLKPSTWRERLLYDFLMIK